MIFLFAIGSGFVAMMLTIGLNHWSLRKWRKSADEHWTERARLLFPASKAAGWNFFLLPVISVMLANLLFDEQETDPFFAKAALWFCPWLGVMFGSRSISHEVFPWLPFRDWLRQSVSSWLFLFGWFGTYIVVGWEMPTHFAFEVWVWFALFLAFQLFLNWRGIIPLLKVLRVISPASVSLQEMVDRVSHRMNCKVKKVWLWRTSSVNALAFPVTGELLFSTRLLEKLSVEEQEAVCTHELGHLTEPAIVVMTRVSSVLGASFLVLLKPAINDYGLLGLYAVLMLWVGIAKIGNKVARKMEVRADAAAKEDQGGEIYARALEKIYELNLAPAVMPGNDKIHPHLYDRMLAVGITPNYPRPEPASGFCPTTAWLVIVIVVLSVATLIGHEKLPKMLRSQLSIESGQASGHSVEGAGTDVSA